jgi:hypothetical protein
MKAKSREDKEKQAKTLIKAITMALKQPKDDMPDFVFKKHLKGITGFYDEETITLAAFYDVIPTLLHEMVHYLHKDWTETKVIKSEKVIKHYITMEEVITILKLFVKQL